MVNKYAIYNNPTKEILDTILVGDLVKCNDWGHSMRVVAVNPDYFIVVRKMFKTYAYSICHKAPADFSWVSIEEGRPYIGPDDRVFGIVDYEKDPEKALEYLKDGTMGVSMRHGVTLDRIEVKRAKPYIRWGKTFEETASNYIMDNPEIVHKIIEKKIKQDIKIEVPMVPPTLSDPWDIRRDALGAVVMPENVAVIKIDKEDE